MYSDDTGQIPPIVLARVAPMAADLTQGLVVLTETGRIVYWSLGAERLSGRRASDTWGRAFDTVLSEAARAIFQEGLSRVRLGIAASVTGSIEEILHIDQYGVAVTSQVSTFVVDDRTFHVITLRPASNTASTAASKTRQTLRRRLTNVLLIQPDATEAFLGLASLLWGVWFAVFDIVEISPTFRLMADLVTPFAPGFRHYIWAAAFLLLGGGRLVTVIHGALRPRIIVGFFSTVIYTFVLLTFLSANPSAPTTPTTLAIILMNLWVQGRLIIDRIATAHWRPIEDELV
jgi:hypothetical protein